LEPCTFEQICSTEAADPILSWQINAHSELTLKNWVTYFDLYCAPKYYVGLCGSLVFFGAALGCLFMPALGDKYGRWNVI